MLDDLANVAEPATYRTTALANDTVKLSANTIDTYRNLVKHMKEENIVHHTYQVKAERAYRIVIVISYRITSYHNKSYHIPHHIIYFHSVDPYRFTKFAWNLELVIFV